MKNNYLKKELINYILIFFKSILIITILAIFIDFFIEMNYLRTPSYSPESIEKMDTYTVAIVPGAAVYGKTPSSVLEDRLKCAVMLYNKKKVRKILLSGDNGTKTYNELTPMLNYMLKNNVKREDIFMDYSGFRTYDTLVRAKYIFQINDAVIVTQRFHLPRAVFIAQSLGIQVATMESDLREYKDEVKNRTREFFARSLAWVDIFLAEGISEFQGSAFPIEGNGEITWKSRDLIKK
jgi:SanA protein